MVRYVAAIALAAPAALVVILVISALTGPERTGWTLVREPEGTTLYIGVAIVSCRPVGHINLTETNESVTIHAYSAAGEKSCGDDWGAAPDFRPVPLKEPLGTRELRGCHADLEWYDEPNEDCRAVQGRDHDHQGDTLPGWTPTPTPAPEDYAGRRAQWRLVDEPAGTRLNIVVAVGSGSCRSFDRVVVKEDEDSVTIEALLHHNEVEPTVADNLHYGVCTADLTTKRTAVILRSPLGDRELLGCNSFPEGEAEVDHDRAADCRTTILDHFSDIPVGE